MGRRVSRGHASKATGVHPGRLPEARRVRCASNELSEDSPNCLGWRNHSNSTKEEGICWWCSSCQCAPAYAGKDPPQLVTRKVSTASVRPLCNICLDFGGSLR